MKKYQIFFSSKNFPPFFVVKVSIYLNRRVSVMMLQAWCVLLEYPYMSADNVLNTIKVLFLQTLEVFYGFVYLFAVYKHQSD